MAYNQNNPNGSATSANSSPVVIASDQVQIPVQLNAIQTTTTGTITTSTSTVVATDLSGVGAVTVSIYGTYAGVTVNFEVFDGVNWVLIPAVPLSVVNPTPVTLVALGTNATNAWNVSPLLGVAQFRVRASAYTSGTASVRIEPSAQFTQPTVVVTNPTAANLNATVTGTVATTQSTSPWITREAVAATPTITQVTPTTTSTTLKASNANRKAIILVNGGTSDCYVTYGATSASTAYTFILPSLGTTTIRGEEYSGVISGIWVATGGNSMQVTEIV